MRAAINCALANRQIITHLCRQAFADMSAPGGRCRCCTTSRITPAKSKSMSSTGRPQRLFVHRKGATRAFGPGHPDLPPAFAAVGQPVLIGGTMGTASYILVGTKESMALAFGSACHGAGRSMSRHQATRQWHGREVVTRLGRPRHPDPQPILSRRGRRSAGGLQGCERRGGRGG